MRLNFLSKYKMNIKALYNIVYLCRHTKFINTLFSTYHENLYGSNHVHGPRNGEPKIEQEPHRPSKLGTQRPWDHKVRPAGRNNTVGCYSTHWDRCKCRLKIEEKIHVSMFAGLCTLQRANGTNQYCAMSKWNKPVLCNEQMEQTSTVQRANAFL